MLLFESLQDEVDHLHVGVTQHCVHVCDAGSAWSSQLERMISEVHGRCWSAWSTKCMVELVGAQCSRLNAAQPIWE
eukprot:scaffold87832_cov23-Tisochrysis_lutea.AAC.1